MSQEELKQDIINKIEKLYKVREEIAKMGKEFGLEQFFREESLKYLEIETIESELYDRVKRDIVEGIFCQHNTSQRPRFNGNLIKDINTKDYEVELEKGSGQYFPVTYRQSTGTFREWTCDQGYSIPIMKEFRARKRV